MTPNLSELPTPFSLASVSWLREEEDGEEKTPLTIYSIQRLPRTGKVVLSLKQDFTSPSRSTVIPRLNAAVHDKRRYFRAVAQHLDLYFPVLNRVWSISLQKGDQVRTTLNFSAERRLFPERFQRPRTFSIQRSQLGRASLRASMVPTGGGQA